MSDALISSLNARISELDQKNANLNSALKAERKGVAAIKGELDTLKAQVGTLTTERDQWQAKATAAPDDLTKEIGDLRGQLSQRDHRDAFKQAAAKAGVAPDRVDDLYGLSGLKPGDQPATPEDFADYLATAKESRPWAFGGASPSGGSTGDEGGNPFAAQAIKLGAQPPVPGGGRGASDHSSGLFTVRRADAKDVGWMRDNGAKLGEAAAKGTLRWAD